jgi:hypothetical protein
MISEFIMNHKKSSTRHIVQYMVIQNIHISTKSKSFCQTAYIQSFVHLDKGSSCDGRGGPQLKHLVRTHPTIATTSLDWRKGSDPLTTKLHLSVGACTLHAPPLGVGVI